MKSGENPQRAMPIRALITADEAAYLNAMSGIVNRAIALRNSASAKENKFLNTEFARMVSADYGYLSAAEVAQAVIVGMRSYDTDKHITISIGLLKSLLDDYVEERERAITSQNKGYE
jgi:hypothetical protein